MSFLRSSFFKVPKHKSFNYQPLYYKQDDEERKEKARKIRLERGSFYKDKSQISTAFANREYIFRKRPNRGSQLFRTVLLTAMMFVIFALFMDMLPKTMGFFLLLVCLILFVKNVNSMR